MCLEELLFEIFSSDFIERTGGDARRGYAQFLRLGKNFFVLQAEFF
jgi:hypothetical protein